MRDCNIVGKSKYVVREATVEDSGQLVKLLWDAMGEIQKVKERSTELSYEFVVLRWLQEHHRDVVVVCDVDEVVGFVTGYVDTFDQLLKPYYFVPLIYVKPEKRKGRASCLLYSWLQERFIELGMIVETVPVTNLATSHTLKFGATQTGVVMESTRFKKER